MSLFFKQFGGVLDAYQKRSSVKDKNYVVFIMTSLMGISVTLPYFKLITLSQFWMYKFRDLNRHDNVTQLTDLQKQFPGYLAITGNVPLTVMAVVTAIWGSKISSRTRILTAGGVELVAVLALAIYAGLDTDSFQETLLILVLGTNVLYSLMNGVYQVSFGGPLGRLPATYFGLGNAGMGVGMAFPALINIVIIALDPPIEYTGLTCLLFGWIVLAAALASFYYGSSTPFYTHHTFTKKTSIGFDEFRFVLEESWTFLLIIFVNLMQTTAVMPALAALVSPVSQEPSAWNQKYFVVTCCFLLFNFGDFFGRTASTLCQWPKEGDWTEIGLGLAVVLRAVFIPLLMFCNVAPHNRSTPVIFFSDVAYCIFIFTFSFLGGYLVNTCCMLGAKRMTSEFQEAAGNLIIVSLLLGLGVGALLGPVLVSIL